MANSKKNAAPTAVADVCKDAHERVVRMIRYVLRLGTESAWWGLVPVLMARLTVNERTWLARISLFSLAPDDAASVAEEALYGAGMPQAPLFNYMDEAAFWADMATTSELKAYILACFNRLSPHDRAAFLSYVSAAS